MKKTYCQPEIQWNEIQLEQTVLSKMNTSGGSSADMNIVDADSDLWG